MIEKIKAVQRMQDYIEEHLTDEITLADLSRVSMFSPWYSHRLFKEFTHLTPAEYIRKSRLSKSALRLRDDECRVIDVAYDMGFQSVDGYQRAFYREFGCNPHEYALHPMPIQLFIPYGVIYDVIRKEYKSIPDLSKVRNVYVQIVEKPERKVIIKRAVKAEDYFEYCEEVACDI